MKLAGLLMLAFGSQASALATGVCVSQEPQEGLCLNADGGFEGIGCDASNSPDVYPDGGCPPADASGSDDWYVVETRTHTGYELVCMQCDDIVDTNAVVCNCGAAAEAGDGPSGLANNANENAVENANPNAGTGAGNNGNGQGQGVGSNNGQGQGSNKKRLLRAV